MDIHWRADFTIKLLGKLSKKFRETSKVDSDIIDEAIAFIIIQDAKIEEMQKELMNIGGPNDD